MPPGNCTVNVILLIVPAVIFKRLIANVSEAPQTVREAGRDEVMEILFPCAWTREVIHRRNNRSRNAFVFNFSCKTIKK